MQKGAELGKEIKALWAGLTVGPAEMCLCVCTWITTVLNLANPSCFCSPSFPHYRYSKCFSFRVFGLWIQTLLKWRIDQQSEGDSFCATSCMWGVTSGVSLFRAPPSSLPSPQRSPCWVLNDVLGFLFHSFYFYWTMVNKGGSLLFRHLSPKALPTQSQILQRQGLPSGMIFVAELWISLSFETGFPFKRVSWVAVKIGSKTSLGQPGF